MRESVKSFIVISVALKIGLNAIVSGVCCEIDENCRGGTHFVIDVVAAAKNRNSIKYS